MNASFACLAGLIAFYLGFRFYAKYLADKVYRLDSNAPVPSQTMKDNMDYVPTKKFVLFGHHFATIAGAAPIIGPALAVIWGWVPAYLWVVLGTIAWGGVHDFGALILSVRNRGKSIGEIAKDIIGPKATTAYMIIIFFILVLVLAVFLLVIAGLLIEYPESVFPVFALMVIAVGIGVLIYRTRVGIVPASIVGVLLMMGAIWWGSGHPYPMPEKTFLGSAKMTWVTLLALYAFIASVLPVWLLLQPRDYLESFNLYAGLALVYLGIFVTNPSFVAPPVRLHVPGAPPVWPFLFITIACGALSGFHSIVSSGTSPKQLKNEKDAKFIGYGGMIGEGTLGLAAVIVCTAGFASSELWEKHYATWAGASGLGEKLTAFVDGAAYLISPIGVPQHIGKTIIVLIIISFAMTTLDSACRLGRYIVSEFGDQHNVFVLKNSYLASFIMAAIALVLAMGTYGGKPAGIVLWPLFGATNQLLAALVFATITIYLFKRKSPTWPTAIPMVLVSITAVAAMFWNIKIFIKDGNWLLILVGITILIASFILITLSFKVYVTQSPSVVSE
jgi:carbon starvation protein